MRSIIFAIFFSPLSSQLAINMNIDIFHMQGREFSGSKKCFASISGRYKKLVGVVEGPPVWNVNGVKMTINLSVWWKNQITQYGVGISTSECSFCEVIKEIEQS